MNSKSIMSGNKPGSSEKSSLSNNTSVQLIRHATLLIRVGPYQFLVDPMLSPQYTMDPVQNSGNSVRIPMTELPFKPEWVDSMLATVNAVIVTHTHRDHWDLESQQKIPKDKLILCQSADMDIIRSQGFSNVKVFDDFVWNDVVFYRTGGQHGTGEIGKKMGIVSGVIIKYENNTIYLAGDTIWCNEVKEAIDQYKPTAIVVNSGAAQFMAGDPITMDATDIISVLQHAGEAKLIAVHMDTVNHCHLTRAMLQQFLESENLLHKVAIPLDGHAISI